MLTFLDVFFTCFHSAIIVFNLFGWIFRRTRFFNLILLVLTGGSWFILGLFYGIGYCPLTDWHFAVLRKLGDTNLPSSYTGYLLQRIAGINLPSDTVDRLTLILYLVALVLSVYANLRNRKSAKVKKTDVF